jgi:hypothetical protein
LGSRSAGFSVRAPPSGFGPCAARILRLLLSDLRERRGLAPGFPLATAGGTVFGSLLAMSPPGAPARLSQGSRSLSPSGGGRHPKADMHF